MKYKEVWMYMKRNVWLLFVCFTEFLCTVWLKKCPILRLCSLQLKIVAVYLPQTQGNKIAGFGKKQGRFYFISSGRLHDMVIRNRTCQARQTWVGIPASSPTSLVWEASENNHLILLWGRISTSLTCQ